MKCFEHPDRDAVAICVACGHGLCGESLDPAAPVSSCRGACVPLAQSHHEALSRLIKRTESTFAVARSLMLLIPVIALIAAVLALAAGLLGGQALEGVANAIALAAVGGIVLFLRWRWMKSDHP